MVSSFGKMDVATEVNGRMGSRMVVVFLLEKMEKKGLVFGAMERRSSGCSEIIKNVLLYYMKLLFMIIIAYNQ